MKHNSSAETNQAPIPADDDSTAVLEYEPPRIVDAGSVRDVTKGSSWTGSADANSQYYWGGQYH
jgi:hypothetical protein